MCVKRALLHHLRNSAYVKLAPSRVAGVGVHALVDIPHNVDPFQHANPQLRAPEQIVCVLDSDLRSLPSEVKAHALSFFAAVDDPACPDGSVRLRDSSGELVYGVNATGFPDDASWYVNHGERPNLEFIKGADGHFNGYRTRRRIKAGEELLACYVTAFPEMYAALPQSIGSDLGGASRRSALQQEIRTVEGKLQQLKTELWALDEPHADSVRD